MTESVPLLELRNVSRVFGAHLTGTADRMRVVGGMELAGRVVVGGRRYRVTMMCERAVLETANDARIRLRATGVSEEGAETIVLASRQTLHHETLPDKVQDAHGDGCQHRTGHELAPDVLIADHHHGEFDRHRHGALIHGDDERQ